MMDDEFEDKVLYQTYLSHMKLLSKCGVGLPLNTALLSYIWKMLRMYILRPETIILSAILIVILLYLQTIDVWTRGLFARLTLNLDKSFTGNRYLASGKPYGGQSWELKESNIAAYAVQGRRLKMEDRFVINEDINKTGISVFAIFDGHGGEFAANYAKDNLMKNLNNKLIEVKQLSAEGPKDYYPPINNNVEKRTDSQSDEKVDSSIEKKQSFKKKYSSTDECMNKSGNIGVPDAQFQKLLDAIPRPITRDSKPAPPTAAPPKVPIHSYLDNSKFSGIDYGRIITDEVLEADRLLLEAAKKNRDVAGSHLIVANVGDSRGVMCDSKGNAIPLSFDHKPQQIKEMKRIKEAGGFVTFNGVWRVAGILATSRALGDYPLKDSKLVIADPDILTFNLTDHKPQFILLASDGLWDTFSNEEAVAFIKERLDEPHFGAKSITLQSYYRGSHDNITVMVIRFKDNKWSSYTVSKND
ncbi:UNVERIFIED_CONTAM: hypothetical protein PYX00_006194 [Menopon gallinae]|uniref:PPM-type phosphatase domain-containing protein n=1 Tax=Menopon gallinae TaxID=328185 RepID=A0AAW2HUU9_9NEOP